MPRWPLAALIKALVIYKDTGVASTSPLLAYLDTVTGFPMTTFGGDVVVPWSNGAARFLPCKETEPCLCQNKQHIQFLQNCGAHSAARLD